jgi:hypothetical protein
MIRWSKNGIEYMYPLDILSSIFHVPLTSYDDLSIESDRVRVGDIAITKMDLARRVVTDLTTDSKLPEELTTKLLEPIRSTLSV